jgi:SAM-dependent methyltransferase
MTTDAALSESASLQGKLWGRRSRDWAELQEKVILPAHRRVFERLAPSPGSALLDVGCGAGGPSALAASLGCRVHGLDASAELLEIARERVPDGDFRLGELLSLPWPDATFDYVTGFNSFQYATDPVAALAEARRVLRPGGKVGIVVWGSVEECEAVSHMKALGSLLPPPPPGAPGPLAGEQRIADIAREAGFTVETDERVDCPWHYPDLDTALRALKSAGPVARVIDVAGEEAVDEALTRCLAGHRQTDGSYLFKNRFRALTGGLS